jgi:hypothetical protein
VWEAPQVLVHIQCPEVPAVLKMVDQVLVVVEDLVVLSHQALKNLEETVELAEV